MNKQSPRRHRISSRCGFSFRPLLVGIIALVAVSGLSRFWSSGFVLYNDEAWRSPLLSSQAIILSRRIADLQANLGRSMQEIQDELGRKEPISDCTMRLKAERRNQSNLLVEIVASLDNMLEILHSVHNSTMIRDVVRNADKPKTTENEHEGDTSEEVEEENVLFGTQIFQTEEVKKYTDPKQNRHGRRNFMGAMAVYPTIGMGCISVSMELDQYMLYNASSPCPDDWPAAQQLMVHGCDPLPRRRCFSAAPSNYTRPLPVPSSLWSLPGDGNIRWNHYKCKGFACLVSKNATKGFFKCADCFDLAGHESRRWTGDGENNNTAEFSVDKVLGIKASGEIRIGLDFSPGTGTFAALLRARNVTIVTATLNLGAPFNEMIALRGLVPLHVSVNQRLPFFDNTLDIVHSTLFLDGWIQMELLEFVVFDWDRILRPGGLLWIDKFFCSDGDVEEYLGLFRKLEYKRHLWIVKPKLDKEGGEVFFSAVLEKPGQRG